MSADKSFTRMESTCLEDELDFLNAVFFEELQISDENSEDNEKVLHLNLEPSTADDKTKQFVFVKMKVRIPTTYPLVAPLWATVNSRGLSDELLDRLLAEARQVSESKTGHSMLYEVIEHLKVYLTEQNKPSESCCVCMSDFEEVSCIDPIKSYTKTDCFHFFHLACFAGYIQSELENIRLLKSEDNVAGLKKKELQLECPVCREIIPRESQCLEDIGEINSEDFFQDQSEIKVFKPDKKMLEEQAKRAELIEKQRIAGGIIDLDEEATRFDVDTAWRPLGANCESETTVDSVTTEKTPEWDEEKLIFTPLSDLEKGSTNVEKSPSIITKSPKHKQQTKPNYHSENRDIKYYESNRSKRGNYPSPQHGDRHSNREYDYSNREYDYSDRVCGHSSKEYDYSNREYYYSDRDRDYSKRDYDYSDRDHDSSHTGRNYSSECNDYSKKDHYYSSKKYNDSNTEYTYSNKDYDYSDRDRDYSNREYDYSDRDRNYSNRYNDYSRKDHYYSTKDDGYSSKKYNDSNTKYTDSAKDYDSSDRNRVYVGKDYDYSGVHYEDSRQGVQPKSRSKQRHPARGRGKSTNREWKSDQNYD